MIDFLEPEHDNPWNFVADELKYEGKLYHYTDKKGCDGIFDPHNTCGEKIELPKNCVALRLTKISSMTKNDDNERRHICDTVKEAANKLLETKLISEEFADMVNGFGSTDKRNYAIKLAKKDPELGNELKLGFGKVDYYVACFSTNRDNESIMRSFHAPIRLSFNIAFSNPYQGSVCNNGFNFVQSSYYPRIEPYSVLKECDLMSMFGSVKYDKVSKSSIIQRKLRSIYDKYQDPNTKGSIEDTVYRIEEMFSLYDAFFKSEKHSYEEEVRLVICIPQDKRYTHFRKNIIFDGESDKYMYLPVNKDFIIGCDGDGN